MTQWPSRSSKLILPHNTANLIYMLCQHIRKLSDIDFKRFFEVFLNFQSLGVRNLVLAFFEKKSMKGPAWISMSWKKTTVSILCTFISFCYICCYMLLYIFCNSEGCWFWMVLAFDSFDGRLALKPAELMLVCSSPEITKHPRILQVECLECPRQCDKNWLHQMHQAQGCITHVDVRIVFFPTFPLLNNVKQLEMRVETGVLVLESVRRTSWCRWHRCKTSKMLMQRMEIRKRRRLRKKIMRTRRAWRTRRIRMKTDKTSRRRRKNPISTSQRKLKRWQSRSWTEFLQTLLASIIHDPTRFQVTERRTKTQCDNFTYIFCIW